MSNPEVERSIEAILMVVDEPVTELTLASVLGVTVDEVVAALETLTGSYDGRGFSLKAINGGWRFYSSPDCAAVVEKFVLDGQQNRRLLVWSLLNLEEWCKVFLKDTQP